MLAICCLATLLAASPAVVAQFEDFKLAHGKAYESPAEEAARLKIFEDNLRKAAILNEANPDARYGVTQFSDLSEEEFTRLYLRPLPDVTYTPRPVDLSVDREPIDWLKAGILHKHAKNQGMCGSCWAFSTVAAVESAIQKNELAEDMFLGSEQQLVDCDVELDGCDGGELTLAMQYVQKVGLMSEDDYEYVSGSTQTAGECTYDSTKVKKTISDFRTIYGEEDLYVALRDYSPISIAIDARSLQLYLGGIVNNDFCNVNVNHGVTLYGYGYNSMKKYWRIRNSWGKGWGEDGNFRLIFGKGMCLIGTLGVLPLVN